MLRLMGYSMPIYMGAGCASTAAQATPLNPVPRRHPVITIVGDPIDCEQIENPSQEQIEDLKARYIEQLKAIFDRFADQYAPSGHGDLRSWRSWAASTSPPAPSAWATPPTTPPLSLERSPPRR
ncbi:unnamed protein product [Prorocentrum cordatum]|uniref:diacylglycerol O-acyltransferase n=1 Tax=Prorocentrum cordatum TaxID=2364126 RepID=A0ABN9U4K1_9DINO|nr:unnamed protein product [Polarella glacialis]